MSNMQDLEMEILKILTQSFNIKFISLWPRNEENLDTKL